jgi:hypothetical protein
MTYEQSNVEPRLDLGEEGSFTCLCPLTHAKCRGVQPLNDSLLFTKVMTPESASAAYRVAHEQDCGQAIRPTRIKRLDHSPPSWPGPP